ncbi:MAG: hypothetical protein ACYTGX_13910 [Planctomycetota bacterium]|jgi:hypothetical protein
MRHTSALLTILLAAGCAASEPTPEPAPEPAPAAAPAKKGPTSVAPASTLGTLEDPNEPANLRSIKLVEEVTGQKFTRPVPVYVYTPEDLEKEIATWGDYQPENILGFYKFATKSLYLVPKKAGNRRAFGLRLHEQTHALQDQLYDLATLHKAQDTTDSDYAVLALIEGQAVMVMVDALIDIQPAVGHIAKIRAPQGSTDPNAFRRVYTYAYGTVFIEHLKKRGGYQAVHEAFSRLPVSTEQVIHPEKYDTAIDLPDVITVDQDALSKALPAGYRITKTDRLGEFETRLLFVASLPDKAESIAAGWGGDATITAAKGDAKLTLRITTWDTPADAQEFVAAASELPNARFAELIDDRYVAVVQCSEMLADAQIETLRQALRDVAISYDPEQR